MSVCECVSGDIHINRYDSIYFQIKFSRILSVVVEHVCSSVVQSTRPTP